MAIYGDILLHFSEQFVRVPYFNMEPKHIAGFVKDEDYILKNVILHNIKPNTVEENNGLLVYTASFDVWSRQVLNEGWFILVEDTTYRLRKSNNWNRYAGFFVYDAVALVGDDGQLENDVSVNLGEGQFK